jgi:hypothetical protein
MRTGFIIVIFVAAVFKVKVTCDSSENDPTRVTKSELQGKEETGNPHSFKPTHEWQHIKEGKVVIVRLNSMRAIENIVSFQELCMLAVATPYNWTDAH